MKICLAIGDRECEEFIKSSLTFLIKSLNEQGLDEISPQIEDIYKNPAYDDAAKKEEKAKILFHYFNGHQFLSNLSLTTLRLIQSSGTTEVAFVDEAPYREVVVDRCRSHGVDVLVLSEMLQGQTNFQSLCQEVKVTCAGTRIIIIGGKHEKGDDFLKGLTEKAIYDILYGDSLNFVDLFKLLFKPHTYADSLNYLSGLQVENQGKDISPAPATPPFAMPAQQQEQRREPKIFPRKEKKKTEPEAAPAISSDTDLLSPEEPGNSGAGTELIGGADTGHLTDRLIAYPYDMKPLLVTDRKTKSTYIANPDGSRDTSGNLPAVIKTPRDKTYELYVSSLMTDAGTPNHAVMQEERPAAQSYGVKAKSILFTSTIQGVGCSTMAFNTACLFASDFKKRVLFVDTHFGESAIFARFEFPNEIGISIDELMKNPSREKDILTKQILLSYARGNDISRFSVLPDTLAYITWSKNAATNIPWITENADAFTELLNRLSYTYDYIVIDSTLLVMNEIYDSIYQFADCIIPVVSQDIYTTNKTANQLHQYDKFHIAPKVKVLINRYDSVPPLLASTFSSDFYGAEVYPVFDDNTGFIRANAGGVPYVATKTAKRKIVKAMRFFVASL